MVNALGGVDVCLDRAHGRPRRQARPAGRQAAAPTARTPSPSPVRVTPSATAATSAALGHQQVVMSSIIGRARDAGVLTRPDRLFKFLNALTSSITVDEEISSISKLTGLAKRARAVPDSKIRFITMPNGAAPSDPTASSRHPTRTRSSTRSPRTARRRSRARTAPRHPRHRSRYSRSRCPRPRHTGADGAGRQGLRRV